MLTGQGTILIVTEFSANYYILPAQIMAIAPATADFIILEAVSITVDIHPRGVCAVARKGDLVITNDIIRTGAAYAIGYAKRGRLEGVMVYGVVLRARITCNSSAPGKVQSGNADIVDT